jgi:hypothetical protein
MVDTSQRITHFAPNKIEILMFMQKRKTLVCKVAFYDKIHNSAKKWCHYHEL